jgi:hypothetical protein
MRRKSRARMPRWRDVTVEWVFSCCGTVRIRISGRHYRLYGREWRKMAAFGRFFCHFPA